MPQLGSEAMLSCNYTLETTATLIQVVWYFGDTLSGATRISHWIFDEPNNVYYYIDNGYRAPKYRMSIDNVSFRETACHLLLIR